MNRGWKAELCRHAQHRPADITAKAHHHIRLKIEQNFFGLRGGFEQFGKCAEIALYVLKRQPPLKAADIDRFKIISRGGDKARLHFFRSAYKQDLCLRMALAHHSRSCQCGIDMAARSTGGK